MARGRKKMEADQATVEEALRQMDEEEGGLAVHRLEGTASLNSEARAQTIREVCETIAEYDRQIDGIKAERKAVIETRIVADLGMKTKHFTAAYKLYQLGQDERDELQDAIRECFSALGIGQQLNWLDVAAAAEG